MAGAQAEAGVMPGAAHGVFDNEAFAQRSAVMGAGGADGEEFFAASGQKHRLVADMANHRRAIGKLREFNSFRKIGTARLRRAFAHGMAPPPSSTKRMLGRRVAFAPIACAAFRAARLLLKGLRSSVPRKPVLHASVVRGGSGGPAGAGCASPANRYRTLIDVVKVPETGSLASAVGCTQACASGSMPPGAMEIRSSEYKP